MPYNFTHIGNPRVRELMREEVKADIEAGCLYISPRFNNNCKSSYQSKLLDAVDNGNEVSLAISLNGCFISQEIRQYDSGSKPAKVPKNAAEVEASNEFNRFYIRAICRFVIENGQKNVVVYRARPSQKPRPESQSKIGLAVPAQDLLNDIRANPGQETRLGIPGVNSGLSVKPE